MLCCVLFELEEVGMKKYLKNNTKINITRAVKNPYSAQLFTTTYGQAVKDDDFTTSSSSHLKDVSSIMFGIQPMLYTELIKCC